jgi:hypothetical protein
MTPFDLFLLYLSNDLRLPIAIEIYLFVVTPMFPIPNTYYRCSSLAYVRSWFIEVVVKVQKPLHT